MAPETVDISLPEVVPGTGRVRLGALLAPDIKGLVYKIAGQEMAHFHQTELAQQDTGRQMWRRAQIERDGTLLLLQIRGIARMRPLT